MSIETSQRVWTESRHSGSALLALLALADRADDDGYCWPAIAEIARRARVSERQVKRILEQLEASGDLYIARSAGRGRKSEYLVVTGLPADKIARSLVLRLGAEVEDAQRLSGEICARQKGDTQGEKVTPASPLDAEKGDIHGQKVTPTTPFAGEKGDIQGQEKVTPSALKGDIQGKKVTPSALKGDMGPEKSVDERKGTSVGTSLEPSEEPSRVVSADAETPPAPIDWDAWVEALCWVCHGHQDLQALTEKERGALTSEAKRIRDTGYADLDALRAWFRDEWQRDWRWRKGMQRPEPTQVRSGLAAYAHQRAELEELMGDSGTYRRPDPKPAPKPAPPDYDDPWAMTLMDLRMTNPSIAEVLERAQAEAIGENGEAQVWQITLDPEDKDEFTWLKARGAILIRKTLASIVGRAVLVDVLLPDEVPA